MKFCQLIILILFTVGLHSCEDELLMGVDEDVVIYNDTKLQIHIKHDLQPFEFILFDSLVVDSTRKQRGDYFLNFYSSNNPKKTSSKSEFIDFIEKYTIYYILQGDSVFISPKFYQENTFWTKEESTHSRGFLFSAKYIIHSLTLTNEMTQNN